MSEELKPCPFCGFNDQLYPCHDFPGTGPSKGVDCLRCGIDFVPRDGMDVIAAWNKRSDESQARLSEAVKVLEGLILAVNDIRGVNIEDYKPAEFAAARKFLATIGEEK